MSNSCRLRDWSECGAPHRRRRVSVARCRPSMISIAASMGVFGTPGALAAQTEGPPTPLESLVEAERAFANTSVAMGRRAAFLAYLADDGIIFAPIPTEGREWWLARDPSPTVLSWQPEFAAVAGGGDLGYTTGPWDFRLTPESEPTYWGHYVSVWRRKPDGTWSVAIDGGVGHQPGDAAPVLSVPVGRSETPATRSPVDAAGMLTILLDTDRAFSRASAENGFTGSWDAFVARDARFYRDSILPVLGLDAAAANSVVTRHGRFGWTPIGGEVSRFGELGFTYGIANLATDGTGPLEFSRATYFRIWERPQDGDWKVVLDLMNVLPDDGDGSAE